jgi:hypothetical protein
VRVGGVGARKRAFGGSGASLGGGGGAGGGGGIFRSGGGGRFGGGGSSLRGGCARVGIRRTLRRSLQLRRGGGFHRALGFARAFLKRDEVCLDRFQFDAQRSRDAGLARQLLAKLGNLRLGLALFTTLFIFEVSHNGHTVQFMTASVWSM